MLISRTPFRISFFGGGTDYPAWSSKEGGAVLSTTIDKYCYLTCRVLPPFFNVKHRVVWSHVETVLSIAEILHPAVREGLRYMGFDDSQGMEIHHQGDLPARAGMGSSSSFAVGLINVLTHLREQSISKHELACKAIELEQNHLKENVGCQDQVAAAYGGLNTIYFQQDGAISVEKLNVSADRVQQLESRLLLLYMGTGRLASEVASKILKDLEARRPTLQRIRRMVDEGRRILESETDLDDFGRLLDEAWAYKRQLGEGVTSPHTDEIYKTAKENGALGGKLLGAGSTGFMVFYVPPVRRDQLRKALGHYFQVPFKFETEGSQIIYHDSF